MVPVGATLVRLLSPCLHAAVNDRLCSLLQGGTAIIVRCPICGKYIREAKDQGNGQWRGECRECGDVTGEKE